MTERGTAYTAESVDDSVETSSWGSWSLPWVLLGMGATAGALVTSVALEGTAVVAVALGCAAGWCFRSARIGTTPAVAPPPAPPDPPGTWTVDFRLGQANYDDACARMLGYEPGEIESTMASWGALVHPEDLDEARRMLDEHTRGDAERYRAVVRMRHRDGHWLWVEDEGTVVERGPDGEAWRARGRHRVISLGVEESPQALAAHLADELRNVLASVEGNLELLDWEGHAAGDGDAMRRSLARAHQIQLQLASFARSVAPTRGTAEPTSVQQALRSAVATLSGWCGRSIRVTGIEAVEVQGASRWLAAAAVVLLDALHQHAPEGIPMSIDVRGAKEGLVLELCAGSSNGELPSVPLMIARRLVEDAGATLRRTTGRRCVRIEVPMSMVFNRS